MLHVYMYLVMGRKINLLFFFARVIENVKKNKIIKQKNAFLLDFGGKTHQKCLLIYDFFVSKCFKAFCFMDYLYEDNNKIDSI